MSNEANISKGPIAVHCSAGLKKKKHTTKNKHTSTQKIWLGVGRTGTFIVADTLIKKAKNRQSQDPKKKKSEIYLNVAEIILNMREQRTGMVQTEEQYLFIHKALTHYFSPPKTPANENNKQQNKAKQHYQSFEEIRLQKRREEEKDWNN